MDFGDFLNTFGEGYCTKWTKEKFCMEVLCSIVNNRNIVEYIKGINEAKYKRSDSTFQSYYRNFDRRFDKKMAIAMINDINKDKFKKFLAKYTSECISKIQLSINFKNEIPDIDENNLIEKITDKFEQILHNERNKPDKRRKKSTIQQPIILSNIQSTEISQTDELQADDNTNDIKSLINKLNEVVNSLINIGRRIASRQSRMFRHDIVPVPIPPELNSELNEAYNELSLLYDKIDNYNSDNNTEFLNKVLTLIAKITKESFIETKDSFIIISSKNYPIHDLLSLIQEYQQN